jgi:hypothetical protein
MADRVTVVPPRDPWLFSTVTVDDLEALVTDGLLRPLSGDPQPEWMVPPSGAAPTPSPGYVLSFVSFHERGFGVPQAVSCGRSCITTGWSYTISTPTPSRKRPSSRRFAKDFWGLTPTGICGPISFLDDGEKRVRMAVRAGGCIIQLRQAHAQHYIPAILVSSNKGWQCRWFYLWNDDGRLLSFSQRVVTAASSNWRYGAAREKQKNLQPLLEVLQEL